jgi:hypothetical protein
MNILIMAISFVDLRFHATLKNKLQTHEMSMIVKTQIGMNITSCEFHTAIKNKLYTYENSNIWSHRNSWF